MLSLEALPILEDNYIWVLHDGRAALAVDPGDAAPLSAWLRRHELALRAVLVTHHHSDHVGGLPVLAADWPELAVHGPRRVAGVTHPVGEGDRVEALGTVFEVLAVPGHTLDHLAYLAAPWLFCGDTLFGGGCGRLFEGSPAQMFDSLARLAALPADTLVCCTHEYTLTNLRFARELEPGHPALEERWRRDSARRERDESTLPSSIALERATNPFLRAGEPALMALTGTATPLACFTELRRRRNGFR
ncbi:hydroxyacylglutathione hydrolase [Chitiniphilus shinanonensis]|uniref:Hydroxyacylglutathione hydrolase n=1 Tax=Chitiniphilus shinanonensis TaxID=553088 RepID=A0ABQ6C0F0_9NEIS|nr:hydroxyacylglutathione hydrolase [Chitiniphilus shinanonensis]GLS05977.1 hydroxyacylglutathione hydrolase [Chitiniphilus shinanonensis]